MGIFQNGAVLTIFLSKKKFKKVRLQFTVR